MGCAPVDPAPVSREDALEISPLDAFGQFLSNELKRPMQVEVEAERFFPRGNHLRRQVLRLDHRPRGRHHRLLNHMFELADVARPIVTRQPRVGLTRKRLLRQPPFLQPLENMLNEQGDVVGSVAEPQGAQSRPHSSGRTNLHEIGPRPRLRQG